MTNDSTKHSAEGRGLVEPRVSFVVPAFNEEKLLPACLAAIRKSAVVFSRQDWGWEMIVCDNASTDRTAEVAREGGARVVFESVNQIGRARNRGASVARGDWLVFVDADSEVSEALFEELFEVFSRDEAVGGGATIEMDSADRFLIWLPVAGWNAISRLTGWAAGSFLFCRRLVFERLGGFSAERFAGEEIELSRRLQRTGRAEGRAMVILPHARLRTSARKVRLYSPWEFLKTFLGLTVGYFWAARNPKACFMWYDGRREE